MSDSTDKAVVFAVDIGVYISSSDGNPTPGTTFGWAKRYLPLAADVAGRESMPIPIRRNPDSHSIRTFVDSIVADLEGGYRVALGFEAPMWVPILHALPPDPFRLYQTRFSHEKTREWYLQPGAAATAKALTFAVLLFSLLKTRVTVPRLTIDRSKWDGGCILLFEAFVAGAFKLPTPPLADRDEWDAQTAAVASGLWLAPVRDTPLAAQQFVQSDHDESGILSLWATAARAAGLDDADCRGRCEVIGLQPKAPG